MTQTGSMGLISAAKVRGTPGRWQQYRHFSRAEQDRWLHSTLVFSEGIEFHQFTKQGFQVLEGKHVRTV
jgi:hypothetical protein